MSLFDAGDTGDDVSSSRSDARSSHDSDSDSGLLAPPPPPPVHLAARTGGVVLASAGRNTLTEADVKNAEALRRQQLAQRLNYRGPAAASMSFTPVTGDGRAGNGKKSEGGDGADRSFFGSSIAAALALRKTEAEKLLLKRIQKDREKEAGDAELVEKDMQVGVFVTAAYKQMLRRHRKGGAAAAADSHHGDDDAEDASDERSSAKKKSEDEEDDPLERYLRTLEKERDAAAVPSVSEGADNGGGDYYDNMMAASLQDEQRRQRGQEASSSPSLPTDAAPSAEAVPPAAEANGAAPSVEELQNLLRFGLAAPATTTTTLAPEQPVEESDPRKGEPKASALAAAREEHERFLFAARESRKRRRADADFLAACCDRAVDRMARRLGIAV